MDLLLGFWERVTARNDVLPLIPAWLTIAAAAAIVLVPALWRACRNVVTIAHEGGHALVATLGGRQLDGIRLHSDTSGLTVSRGKPSGLGMVLTLLAGYSSPALLGLGAAWLLSLGYSVGLLWLLLAALALLLIQVRNWFGLWSVLATATVIFAVTWFGSAFVQSVFALLVTAFLLLGAVRTVLELQGSRSRRRGTASDADQLARLTHIPGLLWVGVFLIIAIACAVLGAGLLGSGG
ncbi:MULTISPECIES: M50 family metallopeptidase [unclassified Cryobacterium]|uniref:M50 family metallopeptidase n=1 Tax=unclassified Cryobacterium TaxID=2649013 RepID=UPI00106CCFAB|nr:MULTISPECIES: M50 family metallopeptidase [unclassified Cryobacterium]TFB96675.1 M50 family peptidase [Cryobacterium sp. MDB2-A-1]TFC12959.1 M50 family peptidase [Cryobacterium sp. MDB2-A-2]